MYKRQTISPGTTSGKLILQSADETALTINNTHLTASGNISASVGVHTFGGQLNVPNRVDFNEGKSSNQTGISYNGTVFLLHRESSTAGFQFGPSSNATTGRRTIAFANTNVAKIHGRASAGTAHIALEADGTEFQVEDGGAVLKEGSLHLST